MNWPAPFIDQGQPWESKRKKKGSRRF